MQPFLKLFLTVLLAHLLGDFPLQSSSMVRDKHQGIRAYIEHGVGYFTLVLDGGLRLYRQEIEFSKRELSTWGLFSQVDISFVI